MKNMVKGYPIMVKQELSLALVMIICMSLILSSCSFQRVGTRIELDKYGDIIPAANVTYNLGSPTNWFDKIYVTNLVGWNITALVGTVGNVTGVGIAGTIPEWTSSTSLGNSPITHFVNNIDFANHTLVDFDTDWQLYKDTNTFLGVNAVGAGNLNDAVLGDAEYNTIVGNNAGHDMTTGHWNTVMGSEAGEGITAGYGNTYLGKDSAIANPVGIWNTAVGYQSMANNNSSNYTTAIGMGAVATAGAGNYNTAVGIQAMNSSTGNRNTAVGARAGFDNSGARNVYLGYNAGEDSGATSDKLYIANSHDTTPLIYGDFATDTVTINNDLSMAGNIAMTPGATVDGVDVSTLSGGTGNITGAGTNGKMTKWTGTSTISDATNTDADVADAVSKKHTAGTDTALGIVGTKNPPIDADKALYRDSAAGDALVTSTWTQIKAFLKTYFDGIYATSSSVANVTATSMTTGYIPVATSTTGLTNSIATANATYVSVAGSIAVTGTVDGKDVSGLSTAAEAVTAAKADADISDAISKKHTQGTDTTLGSMTANITMNNKYINGLPTPSLNTDAATKGYVDSAVGGSSSNVTGVGTNGRMTKWTGTSTIADATNTDTDVADAVSKRHTAGTDTALGAVGTKNPPLDADKSLYRDSGAGDALVTSTWSQVKAFLKTYFDSLYATIATTGNVTYTQGTADYVPKWSAAGNLVNSTMTSNATYMTISGGLAPSGDIVMVGGATVDGVDISAMSSSNATETFVTLNEPTGFVNRTDSSWTFTNGTRILSVTTGTHYHIWFSGAEHTISSTANITITDVEGQHLVYFDTDDTLHEYVNPTEAQLLTAIRDKCLVALIYWDATNNVGVYVGEERHGTIMDGMTHYNLHHTRGLQWVSGLSLGDFVISTGALDTHAQFSVATGSIADEDLGLTVSPVISTTGLPILYRDGATGSWRTVTDAGFSVYNNPAGVTNRLMWNQWTGATWQLTEAGENDYVLCHIYATTGKTLQMYAIMGQNVYTTVKSARDGANTEISNLQVGNLPSLEMRPVATVIFETDKDYANAINARVVEVVAGGDDYVNWLTSDLPRGVAPSDHGSLTGLLDDDHTQYLLVDGTRSMTGSLNMGTTGNITLAAGMTVDGVDISTLSSGSGNVTGAGTSGKMTKWVGSSTISDATNTDTDVASAVSLKHTQGTDTTLGTMTANITMGTKYINSLVDPSQAQDAATKNYVDTKTYVSSIQFVIDGGGVAITTGIKGDVKVPFNCTIDEATAYSDQSGNVTVAIWKSTHAGYPPTSTANITASAPVTITSTDKSQDTTLSGWTKTIAAGDILRFSVDSCAVITRVTIALRVNR
jgi:hypothetical protein